MKGDPDLEPKSTFARAVDALCMSREDIARALKLTPAVLDAFTAGTTPVPSMTQLELVDVLKAREAMLGAAAGSLYEETMYHLESSGLATPVPGADQPLPTPAPPVPPS
jgi:hypothetical protein